MNARVSTASSLEQASRGARWSARLAVIALFLWPVSYAWVPFAGRNPGLILALVPIAEIASLVLAVNAVILAYRSRRRGASGRQAKIGLWLGALVVLLVIVGNVVGIALFA